MKGLSAKHHTIDPENPIWLCPLNKWQPCHPACAWRKGIECSVFLIAQEAFQAVEALHGLMPSPTIEQNAAAEGQENSQ